MIEEELKMYHNFIHSIILLFISMVSGTCVGPEKFGFLHFLSQMSSNVKILRNPTSFHKWGELVGQNQQYLNHFIYVASVGQVVYHIRCGEFINPLYTCI